MQAIEGLVFIIISVLTSNQTVVGVVKMVFAV
jgi:hypothetical protein